MTPRDDGGSSRRVEVFDDAPRGRTRVDDAGSRARSLASTTPLSSGNSSSNPAGTSLRRYAAYASSDFAAPSSRAVMTSPLSSCGIFFLSVEKITNLPSPGNVARASTSRHTPAPSSARARSRFVGGIPTALAPSTRGWSESARRNLRSNADEGVRLLLFSRPIASRDG
eukprot:29742-Pelagococcus_subviridis.AAC.4